MSWATVLVLALSLTTIGFLALIAWIKDRFSDLDGDRP